MTRRAFRASLGALVVLDCSSAAPLAPSSHDAGDAGALDQAADLVSADGGDVREPDDVAAVDAGDARIVADLGAGADAFVDGGLTDANADAPATCAGILSLRLEWAIRAKDGLTPLTCASAGVDAVYLIVDAQTYKFPCADGAGTAAGLKPGSHALKVELVAGSGAAATTPSGAKNPTTCINDIDCVATPACGGEVCDWNNGMKCLPAGRATKGMEGWCTVDNDCKCHGQGARCAGTYCTFTQPVETVVSTTPLPTLDYGCGLVDLGQVILLLGP